MLTAELLLHRIYGVDKSSFLFALLAQIFKQAGLIAAVACYIVSSIPPPFARNPLCFMDTGPDFPHVKLFLVRLLKGG